MEASSILRAYSKAPMHRELRKTLSIEVALQSLKSGGAKEHKRTAPCIPRQYNPVLRGFFSQKSYPGIPIPQKHCPFCTAYFVNMALLRSCSMYQIMTARMVLQIIKYTT